jgi:hypothetical protein
VLVPPAPPAPPPPAPPHPMHGPKPLPSSAHRWAPSAPPGQAHEACMPATQAAAPNEDELVLVAPPPATLDPHALAAPSIPSHNPIAHVAPLVLMAGSLWPHARCRQRYG